MKLFYWLPLFVITLLITNHAAISKTKDEWKGFKVAAEKYEDKAKHYEDLAEKLKDTEPEKASIYKKVAENYEDMADVKDDAARMAKRGKWEKIDWGEYEKMSKENDQLLSTIREKSKSPSKDHKHHAADSQKATKQRIAELEKQLEMERKKLEK